MIFYRPSERDTELLPHDPFKSLVAPRPIGWVSTMGADGSVTWGNWILRAESSYTWTENDVLVWDHLGTIHRAIADYAPDEIRLMRRCQVMATKVFDPEFTRLAQAA